MIRLTRTQLRHLILETSKFGEDVFDKEKNPEKYRNDYINQLVANDEISAEHGEKLKELDVDVESRDQVESFLQSLTNKESLGSDFVGRELLDNIAAGVKDEMLASVVEFSQSLGFGGIATFLSMEHLFEKGVIEEEEFDKIKKIMRVVPGIPEFYSAPTLSPDKINDGNYDIAVYFQQLKIYYYNAREASSYDDMKHEEYIPRSQIYDIATQIKALCEDVVKQGMAIKLNVGQNVRAGNLYLDHTDLYIFDPMWVQSNKMLNITDHLEHPSLEDREKVIAHMSELISQQHKKMDPARRI